MTHHRAAATTALTLVLATLLALAACSTETRKARPVAPTVTRDVPSTLKGTIMGEATLLKADPVIVSGYGLVVGLNGTGGGDLDERLSATMERQLGLMEVSHGGGLFQGTPLEGRSPREVLRSREVAVVIVFGAVIPGAPRGATFDVFVRAASASPDISLEGGTLWTTELQLGPAAPVGGIQTRKIATAHGPIFVNPFAEPGSSTVTHREGRILGGGVITAPLDLELVLDNESHSRARAITEAINNRFRPEPGEDDVAHGRSSRLITITVPGAYRERSNEFLSLLRHTQIDQTQPQEYARRYVEALKTQPYLADDISWCLQALPQKASLPFVRQLYDDPERAPRLAALRAGAGLGDPLAAPPLKQIAQDPDVPTTVRSDAIRLLGELSAGPTVDTAIAEQLNAKELLVRVAAYESLADREERLQLRRWIEHQAALPAAARIASPDAFEPGRILELPGNALQGVRRRIVAGKFILDIVPVGDPLIYVSQQGRPRIVLFGENPQIKRPVLVTAWDGSEDPGPGGAPGRATHLPRLILSAETPSDAPRLLYRYPDHSSDSGDSIMGATVQNPVSADLVSFIEYLAHSPNPDDPKPGLGLTYSEVVGVLNAIQQQGGFGATPLAIEENLLRARLLQAANGSATEERPETSADVSHVKIYEPVKEESPAAPAKPEEKSLVVPLPQPKGK